MKIYFNFKEVRKAIENSNEDIAFVHDDGTYLLIDSKVIRPIKGGLDAGNGDDFVEYIPVKDILSIPKNAIKLILELTKTNISISYIIIE